VVYRGQPTLDVSSLTWHGEGQVPIS